MHCVMAWWELFALPGVSLATSYYSPTAAGHQEVTGRKGSFVRTRANIGEAVRRGIPLRVGIVDVPGGNHAARARDDLVRLGVDPKRIKTDRVRAVGRATETLGRAFRTAELCGRCGLGRAAVLPSGDVAPLRARQGSGCRERPCPAARRDPDRPGLAEGHGERAPSPGRVCAGQLHPERGLVPAVAGQLLTMCQPDGSDCDPASTEACDPAYDSIPDGDGNSGGDGK
ncbi:radical SAM protein [Streptomyces sp. CBMA152]|uniref:radical SAM protein n=1 Tax=Streptomyces sp. CBMA152 TaxID=1896312 RepID=UPI0016609664|nr:radical SAM protein [Streptomyces sp. CBMA152]